MYELGMSLLVGGSVMAGAIASLGWMRAVQTAEYWQDEYEALSQAVKAANGNQPSHLLCGACGLSVPTTDGFTIAEHNCCQPELLSSTGVAQREM